MAGVDVAYRPSKPRTSIEPVGQAAGWQDMAVRDDDELHDCLSNRSRAQSPKIEKASVEKNIMKPAGKAIHQALTR